MLKFAKMEGIGNDYVYLDDIKKKLPIKDFSMLSKKVSDRHFGIGADGLIIIHKSKIANFRMEMYNSDGSRGLMCGNGIRCVGKYVYDKKFTKNKKLSIETDAGIKYLDLNVKKGKVESVKVDMGEPILEAKKIPFNSKSNDINLTINGKNLIGKAISMGNPHAVFIVDEITDELVLGIGPKIEKLAMFPNKTNVEYIKIESPNQIRMRVWERGSGETLACGTGACASLVAAVIDNKSARKATLKLLGGDLEIEWAKDNHVYMSGPAKLVFEGTFDV